MTDISFYQLRNTPLERALPKLLEKILEGGHRALVIGSSDELIEALSSSLWTYDPGSFMPHGTDRDGHPLRQPILLTTNDKTKNGATIVIMADGVAPADLDSFERCLDIFDGTNVSALNAARERWKTHRKIGRGVTYWEQVDGGKWERR